MKSKISAIKIPYRITSGETLGRVAVLLLLLALHFYGVGTIVIVGHIDISLADLVTLALAYIWFIYTLTDRLRVACPLFVGLALASSFAIWVGIEVYRSPQPL